MADLQELFASLKAGSAARNQQDGSNQSTHPYQPPSVSSPIFSPSPSGPQPLHSSAIMSPAVATPTGEQSNVDRQNSLLNLLRFNQNTQPAGSSASPAPRSSSGVFQPIQSENQGGQARGISASDLVASFMRKSSMPTSSASPAIASPVPRQPETPSTAEETQNLLLKLLNTKPPQQDAPPALRRVSQQGSIRSPVARAPEAFTDDLQQDVEDAQLEKVDSDPASANRGRESTPIRIFGSENAPTPFEAPQAAPSKASIFNYVNPFEQLSASSPLRTPKPAEQPATSAPKKIEILKSKEDLGSLNGGDKHPIDDPTSSSAKHRKVSPDVSSPVPTLPDGRTQIEAIMGIGAQGKTAGASNGESVAQALNKVGQEADKQVEKAMEKLDIKEEVESATKEAQAAKKPQSKKADAKVSSVLQKASDAAAAGVKDGDVTDEKVADSWESADAEEIAQSKEPYIVPVYNFPMKPFISIDILKLKEPPMTFRQDIIMDIARLKKEFDQNDRTLATASQTFIVYAMAKNSGFRVIRQDSGSDKQVFKSATERIFNISICSAVADSPNADTESIIGTGVNGTVYWTQVVKSHGDTFDQDNLEAQGLIFPPLPSQEENTSGGQLKTRVRKSNRHPEFFGINRGKSIHLVFPADAQSSQYCSPKLRIVDTEKFFKERSLKITTGKAGKDFAFSEDDSAVVSLDKTGRMKLWDIRELVDAHDKTPEGAVSVDLNKPLLTLLTSHPAEKSWPTSVMFVDKDRPWAKGVALRYLIVGMKQNHTLQLWDLGLQKPVQEINFPHDSESDAICSIAFHAKSGIITVAHPTRNSIYFIHLSAPRYNLQQMTQAKYFQRIAEKDPTLPKPESTAIMTAVREFTFENKGKIRSVDILNPQSVDSASAEKDTLFELYIMHSKGVTCLSIKNEDLGLNAEGKTVKGINAESEKAIAVEAIKMPPILAPTESDKSVINGDSSLPPSTPASKVTTRQEAAPAPRTPRPETPQDRIASTLARVEDKQDAARAALINGTDTASKKKKKKDVKTEPTASETEGVKRTNPQLVTPESYALAAKRAASPAPPPAPEPPAAVPPKAAAPAPAPTTEVKEPAAKISAEASIDSKAANEMISEISKTFDRELQKLFRKLDDEKRVDQAAGAARQDALLRLVSSSLTENVESNLSRIIGKSIENEVLPTLKDITATAVERNLTEAIPRQLNVHLSSNLKGALSSAVANAMQEPETLRVITDMVSHKTAAHVDQHFGMLLRNTITPAFSGLVASSSEKVGREVERRVLDAIRPYELQRVQDSAKIDSLGQMVRSLTESMSTMAASQAEFQKEILSLQRQVAEAQHEAHRHSRNVSEARSTASTTVQHVPQKTPEEEQVDRLTQMMTDGRFEEATIEWLQSPRQPQLFDELFIRCNPAYIQRLSPLVALSVAAAISSNLESHTAERITWLQTVLDSLNFRDPEIMEMAPKIMDVLHQRLQSIYMTIAESNPGDVVLKRISQAARKAQEVKQLGAYV